MLASYINNKLIKVNILDYVDVYICIPVIVTLNLATSIFRDYTLIIYVQAIATYSYRIINVMDLQ